jgi:predicted transcriptional regulator
MAKGKGAQQRETILNLMKDGRWRSLQEISECVDHFPQSITARLSELRKEQHGGYTVERRYNSGIYEYRIPV